MSAISAETKIDAVKQCYAGAGSLNQIAARFGVQRSTLQKWLQNYDLFGEEGLRHRKGNHHYPAIVKQQAAELYLSGQISIEAVCKKYQLRSRSQLEQWIKLYNGQKGFRSPGGRRSVPLTMVAYEERKAAVEYCITHGKNYKLTAACFGFTYQQVYGWVQRYHKAGLEGLDGDHRSSGLAAENQRLRMNSLELEMKMAVQQRYQQICWPRNQLPDFSGVRHETAYQTVKELHETYHWPVCKLCMAAGVSRAGYYKWLNRAASPKQREDEKLAHLIVEIYQSQHGVPGYRQMQIILERRYGIKCNLKRVYRLMRLLDLRSVCRRRKRTRRKKSSDEYLAENILNRGFAAKKQNEKWLTDVTEFKYGTSGKAYLCAVLDLYGRNIVGFSFGRRNNIALVFEAFEWAFRQYPDAHPLVHSDRGAQYTSRAFQKRMKEAGVCQSMSRPGKCLDNAPMEGFWGTLKSEMYYLHHFDEYSQLCEAVAAYIYFYNHERYQRKLGCMTPMEFLAAGVK